MVKAQVLAGGRGKGTFDNGFQGGVKIANRYSRLIMTHSVVCSPEEAKSIASQMLGHRLVTKQTGSVGRPCSKVFIVEPVEYKREFYLAILLDRQTQVKIGLVSLSYNFRGR